MLECDQIVEQSVFAGKQTIKHGHTAQRNKIGNNINWNYILMKQHKIYSFKQSTFIFVF